MTDLLARAMATAAEMTRAGRLREATETIQRALAGKGGEAAPAGPEPEVIEGTFHRLDEARPPRPRAPLGQTLRALRGARPAPQAVPLPEGAQFLSLRHVSPHGTCDYRLYVPAKRPEGPMPLVLMLHGCTQSPEDFAEGTGMNALAERAGCLVAYPAQSQAMNAQKCWNWFRPQDQRRDAGEPALLAGLVREVLRDHGGDAGRVYVAGLSAGGAAAANLAAAYPDVFAAAGVHSGLAAGAAQDLPSALAAMRGGAVGRSAGIGVPVIVFHGQADATVHPRNAEAVLRQALEGRAGLRVTTEKGTSAGGRAFTLARHIRPDGAVMAEAWSVAGAGHAWSGGQATGSYTDPKGPDASAAMLRFFLAHARSA